MRTHPVSALNQPSDAWPPSDLVCVLNILCSSTREIRSDRSTLFLNACSHLASRVLPHVSCIQTFLRSCCLFNTRSHHSPRSPHSLLALLTLSSISSLSWLASLSSCSPRSYHCVFNLLALITVSSLSSLSPCSPRSHHSILTLSDESQFFVSLYPHGSKRWVLTGPLRRVGSVLALST